MQASKHGSAKPPMSQENTGTKVDNSTVIGSQIGGQNNKLEITNAQIGQTLTNCTNMIQQQASGPTKDMLEQLQREASDLIAKLPEAKQAEAAGDLEQVVKGVTSNPPVRRWYSVSAEGLMEAAKYAKDFTGNIAATLSNLGKAVIWPEA